MRSRDMSGGFHSPQIGDDGGLYYDICKRERPVTKQREFNKVGMTVFRITLKFSSMVP